MNFEKMVLAIESAPENVWTRIDLNIYIFKTGSTITRIYPNISYFGMVNEWQSDCYRLDSNVKIEGKSFKGSNEEDIRKKSEEEIKFLNSITIPYRE
jgi:hypothetical protein